MRKVIWGHSALANDRPRISGACDGSGCGLDAPWCALGTWSLIFRILPRLLSDRYLRGEARNQIRQQRLERMWVRFLGSHDECGLVNTKNNRIRLLKTNTRLSNTSTKIDWTSWYNGRGPFIWQMEASDWLSYSRHWLVNLDPRLTGEPTCVCLPLTYMLKAYSLDARICIYRYATNWPRPSGS